ncbi:hypothetical protein Airi01_021380 [Actinoallomurus iriomotensis]|uniref:Coenzyme Q-binding protein COQ10 START domain-containing protein n=2 Tax=Actinoallomurus iriomotensis TaxID=478107 RepID=A0A9W6RDM8_9ACTN|nr:hypothetical protein Airi01_021380 [Actinoallomurus iriomotensis]
MEEETRGDVMNDHRLRTLARGLGWASLGLGAVQLGAPNTVRRVGGVDDSTVARVMVPLVGARELLHTAALLGSRLPERWVWTRVAGDAVDLTALGCAVSRRRGARRRRAMAATAAVAAITALDVYIAARGDRRLWRRGLALHAAITVKRPRGEVYGFWRDLENLPRFMIHLESVRVIDQRRSHWTVRGPVGRAIEWDAAIVDDRPEELITWRSTDGALHNTGTVRFVDAPGGRGTEVHVELRCEPPGGVVGAAFARLIGEHPDQQVRDDLRRFKQVMETGEVVRSEGSPEGVHAIRQLRQRPAQPMMSGRRS